MNGKYNNSGFTFPDNTEINGPNPDLDLVVDPDQTTKYVTIFPWYFGVSGLHVPSGIFQGT